MKRGFTLIELLMVMAVIAILVGIALPRFKGMREEANIAKAGGETRVLKTAIESYAMHHSNVYPVSSTTPYVSYLDSGSVSPGPQLIEAVLYDPFAAASTEYYYVLGAAGTYYAVCSKGPDGIADVTEEEVNDGVLTTTEKDDDICATNASEP